MREPRADDGNDMLVDIEIKYNGLNEDELAALLCIGFGAVNDALPATEKLADLVAEGADLPNARVRDLVRVALAGRGLREVRVEDQGPNWESAPEGARDWCLKQVLRAYEEAPSAE
jgi:hypothetical protein